MPNVWPHSRDSSSLPGWLSWRGPSAWGGICRLIRERGGGRAKTPLAISTAFIKQDTADVVPPSVNYSPSPGVAVTITQHLQRGDLRMELLSLLERADGTFFALHCL